MSTSDGDESDIDFYSNENENASDMDRAAAPTPQPMDTATAATAMKTADQHPQEDNDSGSEMDMSPLQSPVTSNALPAAVMEDDTNPASAAPSLPVRHATTSPASHAGVKRKLNEEGSTVTHTDTVFAPVGNEDSIRTLKFRKLNDTTAVANSHTQPTALPFSIWKQVFVHLSPAMLARCIRVSRTFKSYLILQDGEPTTTPQANATGPSRTFFSAILARCINPSPKLQSYLTLQDAKLNAKPSKKDVDTIWTQSKRAFFPTLPKSLLGMTDLAMFALIGGSSCQFCGKLPTPSTAATTIFNAGPGPDSVRVIWPFRIRSCGGCLEDRVVRDIQVLTNATLAALRWGVTYGFFRTPDLHFVPDQVRQLPGGIPGHFKFSKVYYSADLRNIVDEETRAKTLGEAALDEWRKGLLDAGKALMSDSARWEKWELQMRPGTDLAHMLKEYDPSSFPRYLGKLQSRSLGLNGLQLPLAANGTHPLPQPVHVFNSGSQFQPMEPKPVEQQRWPHRKVREPREVEAARMQRKADIERRCLELDTPIESEVLQRMESYKAALKLTTPMTDAAWNLLKPRLLDQLPKAQWEQHLHGLKAGMPEPHGSKPIKDADLEYDLLQEPLRKRLAEHASDLITAKWGGGKDLDPNSVPIFVSDVLVHVYNMYKADETAGVLPEAPDVPGTDRPFLSLDNMKWVYDNKVRPLTDVYGREQFICAGCEVDGLLHDRPLKWFAFEGLIQHYGAKHITSFSKGNIVVHWQSAEWPNDHPFVEKPQRWLVAGRRPEPRPSTRARHIPAQSASDPDAVPPQTSRDSPPTGNAFQQLSHQHSRVHHVPMAKVDWDKPVFDERMALKAREAWDALDGVKGIQALACIRLQTAIHACMARLDRQFKDLDNFLHALVNRSQMKPLKKAHPLFCKACVQNAANGAAQTGGYWFRTSQAQKYTAIDLIEHYSKEHLTVGSNWMSDMIELPENEEIRNLLQTPGMDDTKLQLVANALPHAFPHPLPWIGIIDEPAESYERRGNNGRQPKNGKGKHSREQKRTKNGRAAIKREGSDEFMTAPNEDEYDPRRPMFIKQESPDPAQFDTDARKSMDASMFDTDARRSSNAPQSGGIGLAPETLAELQRLGAGAQPPAIDHRRSRSPSVGRPDSRTVPAAHQFPAAPPSTSQINFAAILATLGGRPTGSPATPAPAPTQRSVSAAQWSAPGDYYDDPRRSVHQYEAPYQASPANDAARGAQELHAALTSNRRQFEHNQYHPPGGFGMPVPAPAGQAYQYQGEQFAGLPPQQVFYSESPVQYSRPTIFMDQHGRQLEPVVAPPPVQYVTAPVYHHLPGGAAPPQRYGEGPWR